MFNKFKNKLKSAFKSQTPSEGEKAVEEKATEPAAAPSGKGSAKARSADLPAPAASPEAVKEGESGIVMLDSGVVVLESDSGAAAKVSVPAIPPGPSATTFVPADVAWAVPSLHAPPRPGAEARAEGRSDEPGWDEILERARARARAAVTAAAAAPPRRQG
jgi:hypothetical protein